MASARLADAAEVAFHIRHENWDADGAELLGQHAQGDRFPRARRTCDEAVAIGHLWDEGKSLGRLGDWKGVSHNYWILTGSPVGSQQFVTISSPIARRVSHLKSKQARDRSPALV